MSSKSLLMTPMDLQLPPTPPMDLSDQNSNSSIDYKVSFSQRKIENVQWRVMKKNVNTFPSPQSGFKKYFSSLCELSHDQTWCNLADLIAENRESFLFLSIIRSCEPSRERCINLSQLVFLFPMQGHQTKIFKAQRKKLRWFPRKKITRMRRH